MRRQPPSPNVILCVLAFFEPKITMSFLGHNFTTKSFPDTGFTICKQELLEFLFSTISGTIKWKKKKIEILKVLFWDTFCPNICKSKFSKTIERLFKKNYEQTSKKDVQTNMWHRAKTNDLVHGKSWFEECLKDLRLLVLVLIFI